jgi:hypothetical protein
MMRSEIDMNAPSGQTKEFQSMIARPWKVLLAAALMLNAGLAWAGTSERLGTGGASELRIPVGARSVAMSWANLSSATGVDAIFSNPAGLAASDNQTEVMFSYAKYIADMNLNYLAIAQKMGGHGTIGLSVKVLSVGDIIATTESAPDGTGDVFNPTLADLGISYAKSLTDRVNFGGTMYYLSEKVMQTSATGLSFDFGFQYDTGYRGVRLGAAMKNFGGAQTFGGSDFEMNQHLPQDDPQAANRTVALSSAEFELPSLFAGGFSWPVLEGTNSLILHGVYQSNSFNVDEFRFGGEFRWKKDFALRAGYKATSDSNELFGFTYGAGVRIPVGTTSMFVDYAGQHVNNYFDDVHHIDLEFTF